MVNRKKTTQFPQSIFSRHFRSRTNRKTPHVFVNKR